VFSERVGARPKRTIAQLGECDPLLRNAIWSALYDFQLCLALRSKEVNRSFDATSREIWIRVFREASDTRPLLSEKFIAVVRGKFFSGEWHLVYDIAEAVYLRCTPEFKQGLATALNKACEREAVGYRLLDGLFVPITNSEELVAISSAATASSAFQGVGTHLDAAARLLADRASPDYRNSVKESISAVESLALQLAPGKGGTLGAVLKDLDVHPAMSKAFSSLYGWTSDADGIRHALLDEPDLTVDHARFMLVACSAFVNFAIARRASASSP